MSEDIIRLETITQVHEALGFPKPQHPLISVIDVSKMKLPEEMAGKRMTSSFYTISMKTSDCGIRYGRNYYDFEEGVLVFFGPNQVVASENDDHNAEGWMLFFHPTSFAEPISGVASINILSFPTTCTKHFTSRTRKSAS